MTIVRTKRSAAPKFWKIWRKKWEFTVSVSPGPHPKQESYALAVLVRDILRVSKTYREAEVAIKGGMIFVDGVVRKAPEFPAGLMDVIEIPSMKKTYRMLPRSGTLTPVEIASQEKSVKLCKVKSKRIAKGGVIQLALHDGRTLLSQDLKSVRPGDALLIELPTQKVIEHVRLQSGALALVLRGERAGTVGKIRSLKSGTFSRPSMIELSFDSTKVEIPAESVLPVGVEKSLITISGG